MSLSKQEIGTIIIRVIGIYALMQAFEYFVQMVSMTAMNPEGDWLFSPPYRGTIYFLTTVTPLSIIGALLLTSSSKLGSKLVGSTKQSQDAVSVTTTEWEEVALATLGYYLFFSNLPRIVNVVYLIETYDKLNRPFPLSDLISANLMLLLSIWLVLRAKGFVGIIHKIRNAGFRN